MKTVTVIPWYGYGWVKAGRIIETPDPFNMDVTRCEKDEKQNVYAVIAGRVSEPQHTLDGLWVLLILRLVDTKPNYNISFYEKAPPFVESGEVDLVGIPSIITGFGGLGA